MFHSMVSWVGVLVGVCLLASGAHASAPMYSVEDLGAISPFGVNGRGAVAGNTIPAPGVPIQAVFIAPDGTETRLGTLPGGSASSVFGLHGQRVVGCGPTTGTPEQRAWVWTAKAGLRDLGVLWEPQEFSCGHGVNAHGVVVGAGRRRSANGSLDSRAVRWSVRGKPVDLGTLGGPGALAVAINSQQDIVGTSQTGHTQVWHATLWPGNGGSPVDLDTVGSTLSSAAAVTTFLEVGGSVSLPGVGGRGFVLHVGEPMQILPPLPGDTSSQVAGLNDDGVPVGTSSRGTGPFLVSRAVVYHEGQPVELNTLITAPGWVLTEARGINDKGQIAVRGTLNGQDRGALLTPVKARHLARR